MSKPGIQILRIYDGFVKAVSSLQSPFLVLVRLYWGWQISQNGWGKLHNLRSEERRVGKECRL